MLTDNHGREISYLRLAVTDRCNLRCFYCMPHEGIDFLPKTHLLSYEEMLRITGILSGLGVSKIRITGGEPFVRRDLMDFLRALASDPGIKKINLTTNGVLTAPHVPELSAIGISSVNLSLDSLDRERFAMMTRRDELPQVLKTLDALLDHQIPTKINTVVMSGKNTDDIISMAALTKDKPVSVRFIEEMPFNGNGFSNTGEKHATYQDIFAVLQNAFPGLYPLENEPGSTSVNYAIPGHSGTVGIIAAFSRTFCGSCNRIRITPTGTFKTCLYEEGGPNVRDLMRKGASDDEIKDFFIRMVRHRAKDGFEAEQKRKHIIKESMTTIGG